MRDNRSKGQVESKQYTVNRFFLVRFVLACAFVLCGTFSFANEQENVVIDSAATHDEAAAHGAEKKFNPGELIMSHIADAHDWHIYGSHEHPVSIPLPIIIYHPEKGFSVFSSSRFEHGHASYQGYKLVEGKIVSEDGDSIYDLSITKNVLAIFISAALLLFIFISVAETTTV